MFKKLFGKKSEDTKIVLREERTGTDYRYLGAEIKENGDLVIAGQDLGSGVEGAFGASEYEWSWTVKANGITKLQEAIGGEGSILALLKQDFSDENAAGLHDFMSSKNIPFETWSRVGD